MVSLSSRRAQIRMPVNVITASLPVHMCACDLGSKRWSPLCVNRHYSRMAYISTCEHSNNGAHADEGICCISGNSSCSSASSCALTSEERGSKARRNVVEGLMHALQTSTKSFTEGCPRHPKSPWTHQDCHLRAKMIMALLIQHLSY